MRLVHSSRRGKFRAILNALWGDAFRKAFRFTNRSVGGELAIELADICRMLGGDYDSAALGVARPFAEEFPIDFRSKGLRSLMLRHNQHELLSRWVRHWLGPAGEAWELARDEAHPIVRELSRFAEQIGELDLARDAIQRLHWIIVGYHSHKEYAFEGPLEWFRELSERDPTVWQREGWTLWWLCDACEDQGGDNRFDRNIRLAIGVAAVRCGPADWWRLVEATLNRRGQDDWHEETCQRFVRAVAIAISHGVRFPDDVSPVIWSVALSLRGCLQIQNRPVKAGSTNAFSVRFVGKMGRLVRQGAIISVDFANLKTPSEPVVR